MFFRIKINFNQVDTSQSESLVKACERARGGAKSLVTPERVELPEAELKTGGIDQSPSMLKRAFAKEAGLESRSSGP